MWRQIGSDIDGENAEDEFGCSVSLSADGSVLAAGGRYHESTGTVNAGHVRVFRWDGNDWVQLGADIRGKNNNDWFGWSVSLSGDGTVVAIGATNNDDNGGESGHVRVYKLTVDNWLKLGQDLRGQDGGDKSGSGVSLSADGNVVASASSLNGNKRGYVRVFGWTGSFWSQIGKDIDGERDGIEFGYSISLSADGTALAVGAPFGGLPGFASGEVDLYQLR
jgi:hypothetical protein